MKKWNRTQSYRALLLKKKGGEMGLFSGLFGNAGVADLEELKKEYSKLLAEDEKLEIGFKLIRDTFIFTNKRIIFVNKQGLTGKKVEYLSVFYKAISRFSIETSGHFDLDAELKIYISNDHNPVIQKKFSKDANVYDLQKVLAQHCMG